MWRRLMIDTLYRLGRPPWDTPPPAELREAVEGPDALAPGHALDVGCGTGANVIYLATHGWQATGVDFYRWPFAGLVPRHVAYRARISSKATRPS
jgi:SAM-dependent methyltransferase